MHILFNYGKKELFDEGELDFPSHLKCSPLNFKCVVVIQTLSQRGDNTKFHFENQILAVIHRFGVHATFSTESKQLSIYSMWEVFVSHQCFEN